MNSYYLLKGPFGNQRENTKISFSWSIEILGRNEVGDNNFVWFHSEEGEIFQKRKPKTLFLALTQG